MSVKSKSRPGHELYNDDIAARICKAIATSTASMSKICSENKDFPKAPCINVWRIKYPAFSAAYDSAKRAQIGLLAEELIDVARDDSKDMYIDSEGCDKPNSVALGRSKLISENTKWLATKLLPKIYGDRITADMSVHVKQENSIDELE